MFGPEPGHFALALACVLALVQFAVPLYGAARGRSRLVALAPGLAFAQCIALFASFLCLVISAVRDDFSVQNVAVNSATAKPLLYKITGVWGNHEGSILLWALILGICGAAVGVFGRGLPHILRARVLAILGGVSAGFQLFCLWTSNPFDRIWPAPMDGQGMNPLLQDPGLAFHPPILYTGYVGFAVPFAFAVAALIEGRVDAAWGRWVRPWAVAAWAFLTCGIALGSWWSYYVLGWGGYWFWDPVENASLIPWLTGTALVHSAIVVEKREGLKIWTVLLAIATFSFSLSGTFLVRSGILNSVHAFAQDPSRGIFILALLALVIGSSLALFAIRAPSLVTGGLFAPVSREGALVLNNILLCALCAVVVTGTMYPPFMQLFSGRSISVGKPFFDAATIPLVIPLLAAMALGTLLPWKRARLQGLASRLVVPLAGAAIGAIGAVMLLHGALVILCATGAIWVISVSLVDFIQRIQLGRVALSATLTRARALPRSSYGALLAHIGAAITVLGLCGMSDAKHAIIDVPIGHTEHLAGYDWTLEAVRSEPGPNYRATVATLVVRRHDRIVTILRPSRRDFSTQNQMTTEVAIHTNFMADLYGVLGGRHGDGPNATYILRLHDNPLAPWMWLGGLVMAIGGGISLSDRRLRIGAPRRSKAATQGARS